MRKFDPQAKQVVLCIGDPANAFFSVSMGYVGLAYAGNDLLIRIPMSHRFWLKEEMRLGVQQSVKDKVYLCAEWSKEHTHVGTRLSFASYMWGWDAPLGLLTWRLAKEDQTEQCADFVNKLFDNVSENEDFQAMQRGDFCNQWPKE